MEQAIERHRATGKKTFRMVGLLIVLSMALQFFLYVLSTPGGGQ
jgi:hypothetical protein